MELNNLTQQLKREIKELKTDTISAYLREMTNDSNTDYSLWKATKKINKYKNTQKNGTFNLTNLNRFI